jgi:hypothetical protein
MESLFKMNESIPWIMLVLVGDMASSNVRLKAHVENMVLAHNARNKEAERLEVLGVTDDPPVVCKRGRCLFVDVFCLGHVFIGIIVKTFKLQQLIPRCYSISFTFRFPPRFNKLLKVLRIRILNDLLNGGYVADAEVDREMTRHTERILSLTLLRPLRTRGQNAADSSGVREGLLREIFCILTRLTSLF